jgi:transposase-like protein
MEGMPFPFRWLPVQYFGQIRFLFVASDADYLTLDARYERVREAGVIAHQAVLIAIGINWEGQRQVLAVEMANRESQSSWKEFLLRLKERGLSGVEFVVSDDHAGLKKAIFEVLKGGCRAVEF